MRDKTLDKMIGKEIQTDKQTDRLTRAGFKYGRTENRQLDDKVHLEADKDRCRYRRKDKQRYRVRDNLNAIESVETKLHKQTAHKP